MLRLTRIGILIYVGTLLVGIVPFAALAFSSGTLWFTRTCDVPLLAVPSVWLGDSVFLPLFNAGVYHFLRSLKSFPGGMPSRTWLVSVCAATALLSIAVNGYVHCQWTRDEYLGYIDPTGVHITDFERRRMRQCSSDWGSGRCVRRQDD